MQHECFAITHDGILLTLSTRTIEYIYQALGVPEIVYRVHGTEVEGLADLLEDFTSQ